MLPAKGCQSHHPRAGGPWNHPAKYQKIFSSFPQLQSCCPCKELYRNAPRMQALCEIFFRKILCAHKIILCGKAWQPPRVRGKIGARPQARLKNRRAPFHYTRPRSVCQIFLKNKFLDRPQNYMVQWCAETRRTKNRRELRSRGWPWVVSAWF